MADSSLKIIVTERQGVQGHQYNYVSLPDSKCNKIICTSVDNDNVSSRWRKLESFMRRVFLPNGFPNSVSEDYLQYQLWDTVQAFASSLSGSLATRAVLEGVGVGDATSTPLAATLTWLVKDGTGHVGRIFFAWCKGTELDADSKKWRFFADILNDIAICMELCAPFVSASFGGFGVTTILCFAGTAKAIVGVAGGATRAALTQHQARQDNLADVSAKDGSQETLVNLAALITSLWLLPLIGHSVILTWILFILFTILHIFANYRAVKSVSMATLNRTRYLLLLQHYAVTKQVLSVQEVNRLEPVVIGFILRDVDVCKFEIDLGCSLKNVVANMANGQQLEEILMHYKGKKYAIIPDVEKKCLSIILKKDCTTENLLEAYYNAVISAMIAVQRVTSFEVDSDVSNSVDRILTGRITNNSWNEFRNLLRKQGWNLEHGLFASGDWRASW